MRKIALRPARLDRRGFGDITSVKYLVPGPNNLPGPYIYQFHSPANSQRCVGAEGGQLAEQYRVAAVIFVHRGKEFGWERLCSRPTDAPRTIPQILRRDANDFKSFGFDQLGIQHRIERFAAFD